MVFSCICDEKRKKYNFTLDPKMKKALCSVAEMYNMSEVEVLELALASLFKVVIEMYEEQDVGFLGEFK